MSVSVRSEESDGVHVVHGVSYAANFCVYCNSGLF